MQLLCTKNGKIAYLGEHSMLDAAPPIAVIRRILKSSYSRLAKKEQKSSDDEDVLSDDEINAGVTNIFEPCWDDPKLLDTATQLSSAAKERHYKLTHDYELKTVHFKGFGKKYVKQADFTGPEFAQMVSDCVLCAFLLLSFLLPSFVLSHLSCHTQHNNRQSNWHHTGYLGLLLVRTRLHSHDTFFTAEPKHRGLYHPPRWHFVRL